MNSEQLYHAVKESGVFISIEKENNGNFIGELRVVEPNYYGSGYSRFSMPNYFPGRFVNGFAIVEVKAGKYRVTLKKILLSSKAGDSLHIMGPKNYLEEYAFRFERKELSQSFVKNGSRILDYTFTQLFDFNPLNREEW